MATRYVLKDLKPINDSNSDHWGVTVMRTLRTLAGRNSAELELMADIQGNSVDLYFESGCQQVYNKMCMLIVWHRMHVGCMFGRCDTCVLDVIRSV